ncbi:hypothetical protein FZ934_22730 (plasmid) [Rhizobium grahamii]|uniref:CopC domain-containing protein n=1 Tax=Rhizobium grahamii TaxID=1120045 RepID=A0A5Q0CGH4_9HYPH|nr:MULTISPECIES: copper resistance protein CopC [Rhizobium]QFY63127.1 hypothetical protein FZ934_22730 [Rhizobium grahamii]QRM52110.1 hypothetical protein F3Y33_22920 [Rhizobium sp. BG6]
MFRNTVIATSIAVTLFLATQAQASLEPNGRSSGLTEPFQNLTLSFTSTVDVERTRVRIFGPDGEVAVGKAQRGREGNELVIPIAAALQPGIYTVRFTAYSTEGQSLQGTSTVTVPVRAPLAQYSAELPPL